MKYSNIEPVLNDFGELLYPQLHDAKLKALNTDNKELTITLELSSEETLQVTFKQVVEFICNSFSSQNIVLDMTIDSSRMVPASSLEKIYSRPPAMLDKHETLIKRLQEKILQGEYCYVEINPSCGCEAFILCHSIEFGTVDPDS